jgi:C1A family cysteine protease
MTKRVRELGWVRDLPDNRDHLYSAPLSVLGALPVRVDLRPQCPPVYDQGGIGSCTANAIAGAIQFDRLKAGEMPDFVPSRLFIYYNERAMEGHVKFDAGAQIRDGIKSVNKQGVCPEPEWPYDDTAPEDDDDPFPEGARAAVRPPDQCYADALRHTVVSYRRLNHVLLAQLKGCLAEGYPFVFGFTAFSSLWDDAGTPRTYIPLPSNHDRKVGGHAVLAVGYDDSTLKFTIRNSWGLDAGECGYFYMPYAYLTDPSLSADFWTIRRVSE